MSKQVLLENIYRAYYTARKNKRNTKDQLIFEVDYETQLHQLFESICNRSYKVSVSKAFVVEKPVYREIFAPHFIDRVVHHLISQYIMPQMELELVRDTYGSRIGKGTLYGVDRASFFMRSVTANYSKDAYVLKLDIAGYFMNINKDLLCKQIEKMKLVDNCIGSDFEKKCIKYLLKEVIYSSSTKNCVVTGNAKLWKYVPNTKSLFHSPVNCGLPIGNLTSQLFGNIYLNDFDHWVKEELGVKYYGRYVDDMIFMHEDKDFLRESIQIITQKLLSYGLQVHPKKIYFQHYTKGVFFLGRYIKPYRSYISNRTKNNIYVLTTEITQLLENESEVDLGILYSIRSRINSYWGIFIKANSYNILKKIMLTLPSSFYRYFYFEKYQKTWKCKLKSINKLNLNGIILQPACL